MLRRRGRPKKRPFIEPIKRDDEHQYRKTGVHMSVGDADHGRHEHGIYNRSTVYVTFCFICNQKYETMAASHEKYEFSRTNVLAFCHNFKLFGDLEKEMLSLAGFSDPFCLNCCDKILTLNSVSIQLKQLMDTVQELKSELDGFMISSFPVSAHIGGTHYIKERLVRESKAKGTYEAIDNKHLEIELVNDLLHFAAPEQETTGIPLEASSNTRINDFSGQGEGDENDDSFPLILPTKRPRKQKPLEATSSELSWKREKRLRRNSKHEIVLADADPSGQCHLCPNKLRTQFALSRHLKRMHSGITYKCRHCDKAFQDTSNRKKHEFAIHIAKTRGRNFICDQCGNSYFSGEMLRDHVRVKHEGKIKKSNMPNPTPCQYCGKILSCQNTYARHVRLAHKPQPENRKTYPCPTCGRPFFVIQSMNRHQLSHLSLEEQAVREGKTYFYKCIICPLEGQIGFKTRVAMMDHFKMEHPTESARRVLKKLPKKPRPSSTPYKFACEECPLRPLFKKETDLAAHVLAGHKEKKRVKISANCDICGKPCTDAYDARQHRATHNPKCYFCSHCNERAIHVKDMKTHYDESHPGVAPPPESLTIFKVKEKSFFCSQCPHHPGFTKKKRLNYHIRRGHSVKKNGRKSNTEKGLRSSRMPVCLTKVRAFRHVIVKKYERFSDSSSCDESEDESDLSQGSYKYTSSESGEEPERHSFNAKFPTGRILSTSAGTFSHGPKWPMPLKLFPLKYEYDEEEADDCKVPLQPIDLAPFLKTVKVDIVPQNLFL